jgi:excinuclease ABC subunit C
MTRAFDRRLGAAFLETVPRSPGVYRIADAAGVVVYVGKAVNLRRRLSQYRNATRRKKHRKMREIVKDAASIAFEPFATELEAELREAELIRELTPKWNVAGAFSFLYPSIGLGRSDHGHFVLALSPVPAERPDLSWHGAYRSREITGDAFFALVRLAARIGHKEKPPQRARGARTWCYEIRRLDRTFVDRWTAFLRGESKDALSALLVSLLDKPAARRDAEEVQDDLDALDRFWKHEARKLADARLRTGDDRWPIPQADRDALFIRARRAPS